MRRLRALVLLLPLAILPGCVVAVSGGHYGYSQPYYAPVPRYVAPVPRYYAPRPIYRPYAYAPRPYGWHGGGRGHDRRHWR